MKVGLIALYISLLSLCLTSSSFADAQAKATFAGGCFWCMEKPFEKLAGVSAVVSGYTGGTASSAHYEQVGAGRTGHREAVQITYDPGIISYESLLDNFWKNIDPFDSSGQFCDKGFQYTSAIFVHNEAQRTAAEKSLQQMAQQFKDETIQTPIIAATDFYPAEEYHQDFYKKNPLRYSTYRYGCGRDARLQELWQ